MGRKESALGKALDLARSILHDESCFITSGDIDRFEENPQGPQGHPLLVECKRLPVARDGEKLRDLRALPDGTLCLLWSKNLGCDRDPALPQELRVQLGDDSYTLGFKQPMIGLNGTIVGFIERRPIINKFWFDYQSHGDDRQAMLCIGEREIPNTRGRLYGRRWTLEGSRLRLVQGRPGPDPDNANNGARWKETLYDIDDSGGCLKEIERSVPNPARIQQLLDWEPPPIKLGNGRSAYRQQMPGKLVYGWCVEKVAGPRFERISDLFQREGRWHYWGQTGNHLFLMELPPAPKKK
jgi:hypothetical protein